MTSAMLFEGRDLEEVLAEARLCFGPDMEIDAANRVRRGGFLGFFASEWYEVWARSPIESPNAAIAMLDREDLLAGPVGGDVADSFHSMVRNALEDRHDEPDESAAPPNQFESAMDHFFGDPAIGSATDPGNERTGPQTGTNAPQLAAVALAEREGVPAPAAQVLVAPDVAVIPAAVALEDAPRGASVFDSARAPRTDLLWAMLDRLDTAPQAPALPESGLLAFVGDAAVGLEAIQRMGTRTGLWATDVAIVTRRDEIEDVPSWLIINDLQELSSRTTRWRQRGAVVPIIVDHTIDSSDRQWAAGALVAIDPDQVRMVTESWRLPEEVGRLAAKLGGVDAIDLVAVADCVEPLAMLDLDIPVGTIEGRDATAELLAAVWLENRRRG